MKIEDYNEYYIQGSDHYLIPKDVFIELFDEMINWKEENKILKENAENNDKVVDKINWENMLLKKENQELKLQLKGTTHCFDEEEHEKLKKQVEEYQQELEKADSITQSCIFNGKEESKISYRKS